MRRRSGAQRGGRDTGPVRWEALDNQEEDKRGGECEREKGARGGGGQEEDGNGGRRSGGGGREEGGVKWANRTSVRVGSGTRELRHRMEHRLICRSSVSACM